MSTENQLPFFVGGDNLGQRRGQRKGRLWVESGSWLLTYRVYDVAGRAHRETVRIGPAEGAGKLTKKQAERLAWELYLSKVDQAVMQPRSLMTIGDFWEKHYKPHAYNDLKQTTRDQYFSLYRMWVEPVISTKRLGRLEAADVIQLLARASQKGMAPESVWHIRKLVRLVWNYAKKPYHFVSGENPASEASVPERVPRRRKLVLTPQQMQTVLAMLPEQLRAMVLTAVITSANVSELCGLRWKHLNLSPEWAYLDGEGVPPLTIAIRQHFSRGEEGSLKTGYRRRNIPIPPSLAPILAQMKQRVKYVGPEDVVFASRKGTPLNQNNIRARVFERIKKELGFVRLSWHVFRYTHAAYTNEAGMNARDRQALMGHGSLEMTDRYTEADRERMRNGLEKVAAQIFSTGGKIQ